MDTEKLPSLKVSLASYALLFRNLGEFARRGWLPAAIYAAVTGYTTYSSFHLIMHGEAEGSFDEFIWLTRITLLANVLMAVLLAIPFTVSWIRFALRPAEAFRLKDLLFGVRHGRFLLRALVLLVVAVISFVLVSLVLGVLFGGWHSGLAAVAVVALILAAVSLIGAVLLRLSLPLAAVSVDESISFSESWRMTAGNMPGLAGLVLAFTLPLIAVSILTTAVIGPLVGGLLAGHELIAGFGTVFLVQIVLDAVASFVFLALQAGLIGLVYRYFTAMPPEGGEPPSPSPA